MGDYQTIPLLAKRYKFRDSKLLYCIKRDKKERKMSKFGVFHIFDVDGGFGDAIGQQELICIFDTEEQANEFKTKYEKPHVYDCPYQCLECGKLEVKELPTTYNEKDFWWLSSEYEEDDDE